jgi:hypothetical protein
MNISHIWHRFWPDAYLPEPTGFCALWRMHIPLQVIQLFSSAYCEYDTKTIAPSVWGRTHAKNPHPRLTHADKTTNFIKLGFCDIMVKPVHLARHTKLMSIWTSHLSNNDLYRASRQLPRAPCFVKKEQGCFVLENISLTSRSLSTTSWLHLRELHFHEIRVGAALRPVSYEFGVKFCSRKSILDILFRQSTTFL